MNDYWWHEEGLDPEEQDDWIPPLVICPACGNEAYDLGCGEIECDDCGVVSYE